MTRTILTVAIATLALVTGYKAAGIREYQHPNNPLCLEGSPLGRTMARLTQRAVDSNWEKGQDSRSPVYAQVGKEPIFKDKLQPFKKASYAFDVIAFQKNRRSYQSKNMEALNMKFRSNVKENIEAAFRLDPTANTPLQTLLFVYTELDDPTADGPVERTKRVKTIMSYMDRALKAYNLDVPQGNPDHHNSAAEIEATRFNVLCMLDPNYGPENPKSHEDRNNLKKETCDKMVKHLENALTCQEWHQQNGTWDKRSPYRKQDFWDHHTFVATIAHAAGGPKPKSRTNILEDRYKLKMDDWAEGRPLFEKYAQQAFGTGTGDEHDHGSAEPGHEGHDHAVGEHEGHDHEGHDHEKSEPIPETKPPESPESKQEKK
jgi:hypothetical protein